ncbi:MAG: hypothetical protein F4X02_07335 [Chloroflexi bacterium]|nr:hypothetical protein [Chloroflexota bacterium]
MSLFVVFIFAAVLLGAGAMLSPAWRTAQPRVALSAALCLALVVGGAVFYTEAFGWDTLVVDYMLFALLSGVVLGGTLSTAQARAEARGERLADRDQGWPGPEDLAFFALVALLVVIPLFHLAAPLGVQGQVSALHSLATREGESFTSLAPLAPDATVVIAPGFHALCAYLSQQLGHPVPLIQMSVSAVIVFLVVWLAYDFGAEIRDKRLGRALAIALLLCGGLHISNLDGHFVELLGLLFTLAFLVYALRCLRRFNLADVVAGGLMMGAVVYTSLSLSLIMLFGYVALLVLAWRCGGALKSRLGLAIGFPLVALLGVAPWLINSLPLMLPISPSPFGAAPANLAELTRGQGFLIVPLAIWGMTVGLRQRGSTRLVSRLMLIWLLLVMESALLGALGRLVPPLGALTHAPNIARHGAILPFAWFGGLALLQFWEGRLPPALKGRLRRAAWPLLALAALIIVTIGVTFQPLLSAVRPLLNLPSQTLGQDEAASLDWLRENAPADALLAASDGSGWLPVIAERRALNLRATQYFEWDLLEHGGFEGESPAYLFVPAGADPPNHASLELLFEQGGARVYRMAAN